MIKNGILLLIVLVAMTNVMANPLEAYDMAFNFLVWVMAFTLTVIPMTIAAFLWIEKVKTTRVNIEVFMGLLILWIFIAVSLVLYWEGVMQLAKIPAFAFLWFSIAIVTIATIAGFGFIVADIEYNESVLE